MRLYKGDEEKGKQENLDDGQTRKKDCWGRERRGPAGCALSCLYSPTLGEWVEWGIERVLCEAVMVGLHDDTAGECTDGFVCVCMCVRVWGKAGLRAGMFIRRLDTRTTRPYPRPNEPEADRSVN